MAPDCACLGHRVIYKCSVIGSGRLTVWSVHTLGGDQCNIVLHHDFPDNQTCDTIEAYGQGISQSRDCYTSLLTTVISPDLNGATIACSVDIGSRNSIVRVDAITLQLHHCGICYNN